VSEEHVPVLVVGGGTVGLATALFLARHGVAPLVVERHRALSRHPRAGAVSSRSAELFREAGIEERLATAASTLARNQGVLAVETLAEVRSGVERHGPTPDAFAKLGEVSPATLGPCPQDVIDPVLLEAARAQGAAVRFGVELVGLEQDGSTVVAELLDRESGARERVRADHLVAADGSTSVVRRLLDIPSTGPGELGGHMINVLFRADLSPVVGDARFALCTIRNPRSGGILMPVDNVDRWIFHIPYDATTGLSPADFPHERCRELVAEAIGAPEVEVEVLSVLPWQSTARVAQRFREGRVYLVGDAAHVVPPTGGFGLNTGLADAHNLAWKLAAVLHGWAGPGLLDSYEAERQPVARFTMEQALVRGQHRELHWDLSPERAADRAAVGMTGIVVTLLGYQYDSTAVVDPRVGLPSTERIDLVLDGSPGSRVPHVWLRLAGRQVSTVDLAAGRFTVLAGPRGQDWCAAAEALAARSDVPLVAQRVGPAEDPSGLWPIAAGVGESGALLVRPDGFVAWLSIEVAVDAERVLGEVVDRLLDRAALAVTV
jgi:2-polyprenyl-6-methoxyphenol hydroxylase-like FAD-dependent oxidoreductase